MINQQDRVILRDLAREVADIANLPVMAERRRLWYKHNSLQQERPMVLIFPEGAWQELLPPETLRCEGKTARNMELELRRRIYQFHHFQSDNVVENTWVVNKAVRLTGWGLTPRRHPSSSERGAWAFDPVINEPADLKKLVFPEVIYDEAASNRAFAEAQELFGDILDVQLKGITRISYHLMAEYTALRGLEQVMLDMYENPGMLHDAMAFLEEGHGRILRQYEEMNLLDLNNDNTYHSSGGVGYTTELPQAGFDPAHVRPCDMWASAEAQEMAQVSPEMHGEFILAYEKRLLAPFGLNGYGCCEDLTRKLQMVLTIPNLRRVSISPFADVDACAEQIGNRCIYSWKPHPGHLVGAFDGDRIRRYVAHTLQVTQGCTLEIILKDTHTCECHPERFDEWSAIVYRLVTEGTHVAESAAN